MGDRLGFVRYINRTIGLSIFKVDYYINITWFLTNNNIIRVFLYIYTLRNGVL